MGPKQLVHRRSILRGASALAAAGLMGSRVRSALAQSAQGVTDSEILIGAFSSTSTVRLRLLGCPAATTCSLQLTSSTKPGGSTDGS